MMGDLSGMSDEQLGQMLLEAKLKLEQARSVYQQFRQEQIRRMGDNVSYTEYGPVPLRPYEGW